MGSWYINYWVWVNQKSDCKCIPNKYYGETQWESPEQTSDFGYDSDDSDEDKLDANRVNMSEPPMGNKSPIGVYMELSPGEYCLPCGEDDDSDRVIESWLMDKPVYGVTDVQSELEPPFESEDLWDYSSDPTPVQKHVPKNQCREINLGQ